MNPDQNIKFFRVHNTGKRYQFQINILLIGVQIYENGVLFQKLKVKKEKNHEKEGQH